MKILMQLTRIYVNDIEEAINFYEKIFGEECANRFKYDAVNLELARVNNFLIIAGTEDALIPFRSTNATLLVDSIKDYKEFLVKEGCQVVRDIQKVPTGFNMTVKHKDGVIIEYVEHTKGNTD